MIFQYPLLISMTEIGADEQTLSTYRRKSYSAFLDGYIHYINDDDIKRELTLFVEFLSKRREFDFIRRHKDPIIFYKSTCLFLNKLLNEIETNYWNNFMHTKETKIEEHFIFKKEQLGFADFNVTHNYDHPDERTNLKIHQNLFVQYIMNLYSVTFYLDSVFLRTYISSIEKYAKLVVLFVNLNLITSTILKHNSLLEKCTFPDNLILSIFSYSKTFYNCMTFLAVTDLFYDHLKDIYDINDTFCILVVDKNTYYRRWLIETEIKANQYNISNLENYLNFFNKTIFPKKYINIETIARIKEEIKAPKKYLSVEERKILQRNVLVSLRINNKPELIASKRVKLIENFFALREVISLVSEEEIERADMKMYYFRKLINDNKDKT